jgi:FkbM family methyltransferase
MASYSQAGEDRIIDFFLGTCGLDDATYVDVGCSHPIFGSNSYLLYRRGFRGICVDPTPGLAQLFKAHRPRDTFMPYALIPGNETEIVMQFFAESTINTADPDKADLYSGFGFSKGESSRVPATNLMRLCAEQGLSAPDVLCLDIEGLDHAVLSSLDWTAVRPKLVCVEVVNYREDKTIFIDHRIGELLRDVGYVKYGDTFINQIFADESVHSRQRIL